MRASLPERLDPHDRRQLVAERARVDLGAVSGDHPRALEPLDARRDGRRREADAPAELGDRPAVGLELREHSAVVWSSSDRSVNRLISSIRRYSREYVIDSHGDRTSPSRHSSVTAIRDRFHPRATSRAARCSTISAPPSRCSCSRSRGAGSGLAADRRRPRWCSQPGGGRGAADARRGRGQTALDRGSGNMLALMNAYFYLAIDRLPLATVAAIEFPGPTIARGGGHAQRRNSRARSRPSAASTW